MFTQFWEEIGNEHSLDVSGVSVPNKEQDSLMRQERINVYYNQTKYNRFVPRAILADLDPASIDSIKGGELRKLFITENLLNRGGGAGNSWSKGHYTDGVDLANQVLESARREAERCDCIQGIQVFHSIGGGTGSGMGTRIISKLMEERLASVLTSFTHIPHPSVSDIVVEPYNAILSMHSLIECMDQTYLFDNNALNTYCDRFLKLETANYEVMNQIVCRALSGITASLRFHGNQNNDLRELSTILIPSPRLSFFLFGLFPFTPPGTMDSRLVTVSDLANGMLDPLHYLATCNPRHKRRNISLATLFRGRLPIKELEKHISAVQAENIHHFTQMMPTCVKSAVCSVTDNLGLSCVYIANTTAITSPLRSMLNQFDKLFRRKAYLQTYFSDGMDPMEFEEARSNVEKLFSEYAYYNNNK